MADMSTGGRPSDQLIRTWGFVAICIWVAVGAGLLLIGLGKILSVAFEALAAFLIAGLFLALIRPFTHWLRRRGMGKGWSTVLSMLVLIGAMMLIAIVFIGPVVNAAVQFVQNAPAEATSLQSSATHLSDKFKGLPTNVQQGIQSAGQALSAEASAAAKSFANFFIGTLSSIFVLGINMFMALVLTIWFLLDGEHIAKSMLSVVPNRWRDDVYEMVTAFDRSFSGYLIGLAVCVTAIFLICGLGFTIIKLPYAWFLAALIGILDVIPFVGPILGGILAVLVGLTVSPLLAVLAGLIVLVGEQFTDSLLSPIVMGKQVTVHPVAIIFSLAVGIAVAGFAGAILAIPVAAVVHSVYVYYRAKANPLGLEGTPSETVAEPAAEESSGTS